MKKLSQKAKNRIINFIFAFLKAFIYYVIIFVLQIHGFYKFCLVVLLLYIFHLYNNKPLKKKNDTIKIWFGVPGSGKTTMAAYITKQARKRGDFIYSNVEISDNYILDPLKDLGVYSFWNDGAGAEIIIDEASIDLDCRDFKSFPATAKKFFALHRHEGCEVHVFSQAIDIDKKIRDRAACCYYLQRSILPFHISYRKIKKTICINEEKQLLDGFDFVPLSRHLVFSPPLWKMFDTLDRSMCPTKTKEWKRYGEKNDVEKKDIILGLDFEKTAQK